MRRTQHLIALCITFSSFSIAQKYFPEHAFEDDSRINNLVVRWYSEQLNALQEPSLWEARNSKTAQVFRFLWLRSFNHPIVVRVEVAEGGTGTLTAKMSNGTGGFKPGKLIENRTSRVSKEVIEKFLAQVNSMDYWGLPSRDPNARGEDGAEWILEAIRGGKYKLVSRWSPRNGPIKDLALMLLNFSSLKVPAEQIY